MVRHGSFLVIAAVLVACAPDPQKKHPLSTMSVHASGQAGGTPAAAGVPGTAGVAPDPGGPAGGGGGSTGAGGEAGAAAGAGAAGDSGDDGSAGSDAAGPGAADGGAAGKAAPVDASAGAVDARAAETAAPQPPVNPCNRATWTFVPSVVCACAGAAASTKDPANAIDGNVDTRYTTGISQGSKGTETATLMFAAPVTIGGITLVSKGGDGPSLYRVDWSTDGTTFWNFEPAVTGLGSDNMTVPFPAPKKVRGVRITQLGIKPTNWWSIHELGVMGCAP